MIESEEKDIHSTSSVKMVGLSVIMAARAIESFFNTKLKPSGVSMSRLYLMYTIAQYRGQTVTYMAKKLGMDRTTFIRLVCNSKKYISVFKNQIDNRGSYPALTEEGAEFLKKWMPRLLSLERGLGVLVQDRENFINFIKKFSCNIVNAKESENDPEAIEQENLND